MTVIYNKALQDLDVLAFLNRWVPSSRPIVITDLSVLAHSPREEWAMIWDKNQESQDENTESGNLGWRGRRRPGEAWSINGLKSRGIETFVWLSTIFSAVKSILQKIIIWYIIKSYETICLNRVEQYMIIWYDWFYCTENYLIYIAQPDQRFRP